MKTKPILLSFKSITLKLKGGDKNTKAIGAKAEIFYNKNQYSVLENYPSQRI